MPSKKKIDINIPTYASHLCFILILKKSIYPWGKYFVNKYCRCFLVVQLVHQPESRLTRATAEQVFNIAGKLIQKQ